MTLMFVICVKKCSVDYWVFANLLFVIVTTHNMTKPITTKNNL